MSRFNGVASERGIERVDTAFEFLYPAFDGVPNAVGENLMTDTESAGGRSVSRRPVGDHHRWRSS